MSDTSTATNTRNKHNYATTVDKTDGSAKIIIKAKNDEGVKAVIDETINRLEGMKTMLGLN